MLIQYDAKETFDCPHCQIRSLHLQKAKVDGYTETIKRKGPQLQKDVTLRHIIYNCVNCGKDTYFLVRDKYRIFVDRSTADMPAQEIHHFPVTTPTSHQSVPEKVKEAMVEAEKCLSVGAFNACGVMARRAIHVLCQDKKAKGSHLFEQLKYLRDNNLITPDIWEWTEELRIVGRSGAHPEWEDVSREDAHYAVRFLREIIRYVYVNPFERSRRKLKETKKKTEKS